MSKNKTIGLQAEFAVGDIVIVRGGRRLSVIQQIKRGKVYLRNVDPKEGMPDTGWIDLSDIVHAPESMLPPINTKPATVENTDVGNESKPIPSATQHMKAAISDLNTAPWQLLRAHFEGHVKLGKPGSVYCAAFVSTLRELHELLGEIRTAFDHDA